MSHAPFSEGTETKQADDVDTEDHLVGAIIMAGLGGFSNGFAVNVAGDVVRHLQQDRPFDPHLNGLISGSIFLGGACGCLLGGYFADLKGRKSTSIVGEVIIIFSCMVTCISPHPAPVIIFRMTTGIGIGICQAAKPIYVSELSPASFRGRVMAVFSLMYSAGLLATKMMDFVLADVDPATLWRLLVITGAIPATVLLLVLVLCIPESPVWLRMNEKASTEETKDLIQEDCTVTTDEETKPISKISSHRGLAAVKALFGDERHRRPLLLSLVLISAHQLTGAAVIILNSTSYMRSCGASTDASFLAMFVGVAHFCGACIGLGITDCMDRRPQLLLGMLLVFVSLTTLGAVLSVSGSALLSLRVSLLYVYIAAYQAMVAPMFGAIVTEIFPVRVRSIGISFVFFMLFGACFLVLLLYGSVGPNMSNGAWCFVFSAAALLTGAALTSTSVLPETNGISLYDIDAIWGVGQASSPDEEQTPKFEPVETHSAQQADP